MARTPAPPQPHPANLSPQQMREALPKLRRRLNELEALDVGSLGEGSYRNTIRSLVTRIDATIIEIFAPDTIEYRQFSVHSLDDTAIIMGGGPQPITYHLPGIRKGISRAISKLKDAIDILSERLEDTDGNGGSRILRAYQGFELHPEIARAASTLYRDGHYANAIEAAVKSLNNLVRSRSGESLDGTRLMQKVFSSKAPMLRFDKLENQSDIDEQQGFQSLFAGAVMGLRNPRAHGFIKDDPERALECIAFISLLAKLLDEAEQG